MYMCSVITRTDNLLIRLSKWLRLVVQVDSLIDTPDKLGLAYMYTLNCSKLSQTCSCDTGPAVCSSHLVLTVPIDGK